MLLYHSLRQTLALRLEYIDWRAEAVLKERAFGPVRTTDPSRSDISLALRRQSRCPGKRELGVLFPFTVFFVRLLKTEITIAFIAVKYQRPARDLLQERSRILGQRM